MKSKRRFSRLDDVQPDINVTPLVDVVLVLLIIFMVVAPRLDHDIPVDLPGVFNPDPDAKHAVEPIKVTVAKAGEYYIDGQKYDLDGAVAYLGTRHATDPLRRLALRADATLAYGDVREIFARCQAVGFPGMSLLVGERHKPGAARGDESPSSNSLDTAEGEGHEG